MISWPTNAFGFKLQSTDTLAPADWKDVTNAATIVGSEHAVTNSVPERSRFYRLRNL